MNVGGREGGGVQEVDYGWRKMGSNYETLKT